MKKGMKIRRDLRTIAAISNQSNMTPVAVVSL